MSNVESPLEEKRIEQNNYRGFLNLAFLALFLSQIRLIYENYVKYGIIFNPQNFVYFLIENNNFLYLFCVGLLIVNVIIYTFIIEMMLSKSGKAKRTILYVAHVINLGALLSVPLYLHKYKIVTPSK